jgi:NADPH:quinone reductase-like Zn-dependent oxidoreductase
MHAAWYERKGAAREVLRVGQLPVPEPGSGEVRVRVAVYVMGEAAHQEAITDITTAPEAGLLHPVALQRFSLDEIATAHEAVETGHTAGKVLIELVSDL